tara:strand:+ start:909 stop:1199 length:291 start_codon:yes stop_codon:yes gene_type:complete
MVALIIELLVIAGIVGFFIAQVALPIANRTRLFPLFRSPTKLASELSEAQTQLEEKTELVALQEQLVNIEQERLVLEIKQQELVGKLAEIEKAATK